MNSDRQLLVDSCSKILGDHVTAQLRERAAGGEWPRALWQVLTKAGLTAASLPEALGGPGCSLSDALALLGPVGAAAAPVPLAEHLLASRVLAEQGGPGDEFSTLVLLPQAHAIQIRDGEANGALAGVPWARSAGSVLAAAENGEAWWFNTDGTTVKDGSNLAGEARDIVQLRNTQVTRVDLGAWQYPQLLAHLALARAVAMAGAMETVLAMSLDYAQTRKQFAKPIAGFQAVQHTLAVMAGEVAASRRAADAGLDAIGTSAMPVQAAAAKVRVGEAVRQVGSLAHQVHGAMGFTHEHPLHQFTRSLWAWRDEYGAEAHWSRVLGEHFIKAGADAVWSALVDPAQTA